MTDELKIPVAFDNRRRPVHPFEWVEADGPYICPECEKQVHHRRASARLHPTAGTVQVVSHFAHSPSEPTFCGGGTGESELHKLAKFFVARYINEALLYQREWPIYESYCKSCGTLSKFQVCKPSRSVEPEYEYLSGTGRRLRLDVGCEKFGIEIFHKHSVDKTKESDLTHDGFWWVELHAQPLTIHPSRWVSARNHEPEDCYRCLVQRLSAVRQDLDRAREARKRLDALSSEIVAADRRLVETRYKIGNTEAEALVRLEKDTREARGQLDRARHELEQARAETASQRTEFERVAAEIQEAKETQRRCLTFLGKNFRSHAEMVSYLNRLSRL